MDAGGSSDSQAAPDRSVFPQADLAENKSGHLTESQKQALREQAGGVRTGELKFAGGAVVAGVAVLLFENASSLVIWHYGFPLLCFVLAAFLVYHAVAGTDALSRDLRDPQVRSQEGRTKKREEIIPGPHADTYVHLYLAVGGMEFRVDRYVYQAAPDGGYIRIYYLPRSRQVVNLEHVPVGLERVPE